MSVTLCVAISLKAVLESSPNQCTIKGSVEVCMYLRCYSDSVILDYRERKKRIEKPRRFSRSHSRSPSPPPFRGRNTAMDAQEALARRSELVKILILCDK